MEAKTLSEVLSEDADNNKKKDITHANTNTDTDTNTFSRNHLRTNSSLE